MAFDPVHRWRTRRPLVLLAFLLVCGAAIGYQNAVPWWIWGIGFAAYAFIGILKKRAGLIFSSVLLLGALLTTAALIRPDAPPQDDVLLTGVVAEEPHVTEERTRILLKNACADGKPLGTRVMLYLYGNDLPPLEYGASVSATVDLTIPSAAGNPYGYDYSEWLWRQGAALSASASDHEVTVSPPTGFSLKGTLLRFRARLQAVVNRLYSGQTAPLVSALLLGDRTMMPDELYDQFHVAGLAHLLAISGLHISCLAVMLDFLLRRLRCPRKASAVITTLILTAYGAMIGFPASICRAILMYAFSAAARLLGRPSDGLTGLSAALIILLVIEPLYIADASFLMSFTSVAGLIALNKLLTPRTPDRIPRLLRTPFRWLLSFMMASLAAHLSALPVIACLFSSISTYLLLANLPALPLMMVALPVTLASVLTGLFWEPAARLIAFPAEWMLRGLTILTGWVASLPGAAFSSPVWPELLLIPYALAFLLCSPVSGLAKRPRRLILVAMPVLMALALLRPATYPTTGLEVLFLDVGQADAAVLRAEDQYYLVDTGEYSDAADYLADVGVRPEGVFLTHPHADHAGGLKAVLDVCQPATLYLPCLWESVDPDEGVPELIESARRKGWTIRLLESGDRLQLSEHVAADVYQPWPGMTDDANSASLVLHVTLGESSVLFTGDLTTEGEWTVFPDCDVLKVAHHGSKSSTSSLFLRMTTPSAAIVSVGRNSYGHPSDEVLSRLKEAGAAVYRTDECGAVSALLSPDGGIQITPMKSPDQSEDI